MQEDAQHIGDLLWNNFKRPKDLQKWNALELKTVFRERLDNSAGSVMKSYLEECSRGVGSLFADKENELKSHQRIIWTDERTNIMSFGGFS